MLVVAVVVVLSALGGLGAAVAAVHAGRAEAIGLGILTIAYLLAIGISIFLGLGVNAAFSNAALRRYPLAARDRFAARHLTAFLEPVWLVCLALYAGIAAGFCVLRVASVWLALPAALLLLATNFLVVRVLVGAGEWVMGSRAAPFVLVALGGAGITAPPLLHERAAVHVLSVFARFAPPGIAVRIITGGWAASSAAWLIVLVAWAALLAWLLLVFDRLPARSRTIPGVKARWDGPCDRVGRLFDPSLGPLVAKVLCYYTRSPQVRWNFLFALPVLLLLTLRPPGERPGIDPFLYLLGAMAAVGFLSTGMMSLNVFGFDGAGFRRYFLLPVTPALVVRAVIIVAAIPGAALVTVALVVWALFPAVPTTPRMFAMLASSGFGGLLFSQAGSVAIAVLWPRPAQFAAAFGNRLPAAGGLALCAGMAVFLGLPFVLHAAGTTTVLRYWAAWPLMLLVSAAWYLLVERVISRVFVARRERMLEIIEAQQVGPGASLFR